MSPTCQRRREVYIMEGSSTTLHIGGNFSVLNIVQYSAQCGRRGALKTKIDSRDPLLNAGPILPAAVALPNPETAENSPH